MEKKQSQTPEGARMLAESKAQIERTKQKVLAPFYWGRKAAKKVGKMMTDGGFMRWK